MDITLFNLKDGFAEAVVRGYRTAFLTMDDYKKLILAENLDDLRSLLEDTSYSSFMQDEPTPLNVNNFVKSLKSEFSKDFNFLKSLSETPLLQFLEFIVKEKMIDNVVMLLQGSFVNKNEKNDKLIDQVDPIGWFPEFKVLFAYDSCTEDFYKNILIETPVGNYFEQYFETLAEGSADNIYKILENTDYDMMRAYLKKLWLEDFKFFCDNIEKVGDDINTSKAFPCTMNLTKKLMNDVLAKEADYLVLGVTFNSMSSAISMKNVDKNPIFPSFGHFYPVGTELLRRAHNESSIKNALETFPEYLEMFELCKTYYTRVYTDMVDQVSFEDLYYRQMINICSSVFEYQMHYAIFYGWFKLKEQEIRNIVWIAEMIAIGKKDKCLDMVLPIPNPRSSD